MGASSLIRASIIAALALAGCAHAAERPREYLFQTSNAGVCWIDTTWRGEEVLGCGITVWSRIPSCQMGELHARGAARISRGLGGCSEREYQPTLTPGQSWSRGPFACEVGELSITCANAEGHAFRLETNF